MQESIYVITLHVRDGQWLLNAKGSDLNKTDRELLLLYCTQGLTGAAVDLYTVASQEHEERGVTGAVGGILRQIPGTVVKPVILFSEATRHVLGGVKNQFVPDARREAQKKWKTVDTND